MRAATGSPEPAQRALDRSFGTREQRPALKPCALASLVQF